MKEYTSEIKLYFVGNILKANSVEEYKQSIIDQYQEEFGIEIDEKEIKKATIHDLLSPKLYEGTQIFALREQEE
jgi:hypothetical protein